MHALGVMQEGSRQAALGAAGLVLAILAMAVTLFELASGAVEELVQNAAHAGMIP